MLYRLLLLLIPALLASPVFAQSDRANELLKEAIRLMDDGAVDESIPLLQEAIKLDPNNTTYHYEHAFAYYLKEDYKKAIKLTNPLIKKDNVFDQMYQIRGNSYDLLGQPAKAIKTYEEGLKKFPKSGHLHLELGVMQLKENNRARALQYFENGIAAAPLHPSNYYWAAKLFLESEEEVWGMLYGEIFRNLEPNTKRSTEISKLLYDTYASEIKITSDTSMSVSFSKSNTLTISDLQAKPPRLPFGSVLYELSLMIAAAGEKEISLSSLDRIRTKFVSAYSGNKHSTNYNNLVQSWHEQLLRDNQFEAYNYWLLSEGNTEAFGQWLEQNEEKFETFVTWYNQNQFPVSEQQFFHRNNIFR